MDYPEWDESASDDKLIAEFYEQLLTRYPQLKEDIEYNGGLLHLDMARFRDHAEGFCKNREFEKAESCFIWVNEFFCRSKKDLLNAFNVSFLEYFEYYHGLTYEEFESIMPKQLLRGYIEMKEYMERLAKSAKERSEKT